MLTKSQEGLVSLLFERCLDRLLRCAEVLLGVVPVVVRDGGRCGVERALRDVNPAHHEDLPVRGSFAGMPPKVCRTSKPLLRIASMRDQYDDISAARRLPQSGLPSLEL